MTETRILTVIKLFMVGVIQNTPVMQFSSKMQSSLTLNFAVQTITSRIKEFSVYLTFQYYELKFQYLSYSSSAVDQILTANSIRLLHAQILCFLFPFCLPFTNGDSFHRHISCTGRTVPQTKFRLCITKCPVLQTYMPILQVFWLQL